MASSSLRVSRILREEKKATVVFGRRSFTEVVGLLKTLEEERFYANKELIAAVLRWLKEASASLEAPASACSGCEKVQATTQPSLGVSHAPIETGG